LPKYWDLAGIVAGGLVSTAAGLLLVLRLNSTSNSEMVFVTAAMVLANASVQHAVSIVLQERYLRRQRRRAVATIRAAVQGNRPFEIHAWLAIVIDVETQLRTPVAPGYDDAVKLHALCKTFASREARTLSDLSPIERHQLTDLLERVYGELSP
jgi:hypothetical protein